MLKANQHERELTWAHSLNRQAPKVSCEVSWPLRPLSTPSNPSSALFPVSSPVTS